MKESDTDLINVPGTDLFRVEDIIFGVLACVDGMLEGGGTCSYPSSISDDFLSAAIVISYILVLLALSNYLVVHAQSTPP